MRYKIVALTLSFALFATIAQAYTVADTQEYRESFGLFNMIEESDIVAVGTVEHTIYVKRPMLTTDIVIRVTSMIKGEPNMGDDHIIFMVKGGIGYDSDGDLVQLEISTEPTFTVDESVMVFLSKRTNSKTGRHRDYAHDKLHVIGLHHGKRLIKDSTLKFGYVDSDDDVKFVKFPLDLTMNLAKAFVADKDSAVDLEAQIKRLVLNGKTELTDALKTKLNNEANTIINREDE